MQMLAVIGSIFASLFGWIIYLFNNYPRAFFAGLIALVIFAYIFYRYFVKGSMTEIARTLSKLSNPNKSDKQFAANRIEPDDEHNIAGLDSQLEEIYKQITLPRSISTKLREDIGLRNVRGVILHGPPGTGKTMLARNLAKKIGCKSTRKVAAVSLLDKYYGSTEENIRELFVHKPGELHMVILDEIDTICPIRTSGMTDSKFYTGITSQLLSIMEGNDCDPDIILVGTTNNLSTIDPAMLRPGRFDVHLEIKVPDEDARTDIFRVYTESLIDKGLMEKYDMDSLIERTKGFTGADIENTVRKAITTALYRHDDEKSPFCITEADIIESI